MPTSAPRLLETKDEFILGLRENYPLSSDDAYSMLKFLIDFSMGHCTMKIEPNPFSKRLAIFITDLYAMGYKNEKIMTLVEWACERIKLEGVPRYARY